MCVSGCILFSLTGTGCGSEGPWEGRAGFAPGVRLAAPLARSAWLSCSTGSSRPNGPAGPSAHSGHPGRRKARPGLHRVGTAPPASTPREVAGSAAVVSTPGPREPCGLSASSGQRCKAQKGSERSQKSSGLAMRLDVGGRRAPRAEGRCFLPHTPRKGEGTVFSPTHTPKGQRDGVFPTHTPKGRRDGVVSHTPRKLLRLGGGRRRHPRLHAPVALTARDRARTAAAAETGPHRCGRQGQQQADPIRRREEDVPVRSGEPSPGACLPHGTS